MPKKIQTNPKQFQKVPRKFQKIPTIPVRCPTNSTSGYTLGENEIFDYETELTHLRWCDLGARIAQYTELEKIYPNISFFTNQKLMMRQNTGNTLHTLNSTSYILVVYIARQRLHKNGRGYSPKGYKLLKVQRQRNKT